MSEGLRRDQLISILRRTSAIMFKLFGGGLYSAVCTKNTGWKRQRHEARMEFLRSTAWRSTGNGQSRREGTAEAENVGSAVRRAAVTLITPEIDLVLEVPRPSSDRTLASARRPR
jgi:hypothetical protein